MSDDTLNFYDPFDYANVGESLERALMAGTPLPFDGLPKFKGVGIYALYYLGDFEPYSALAEINRAESTFCSWAIYVGKASAGGGRKGDALLHQKSLSRGLHDRVNEHVESIQVAENLDIADFRARVLTLPPVWVPLAEGMAIRRSSPLWNGTIGGFGNHAPGGGRGKQKRSDWDTLHPGRAWATLLPKSSNSVDVISSEARRKLDEVRDQFLKAPPPETDLHDREIEV